MTTVKARGILRHHFWGDYVGQLGLVFDSPESARDALRALKAPGWAQGEKAPQCLVLTAGSEALRPAIDELEALRTDGPEDCPSCSYRKRGKDCNSRTGREPIDGCRHSIDHGPTFAIAIEVTPAEQLTLEATCEPR